MIRRKLGALLLAAAFMLSSCGTTKTSIPDLYGDWEPSSTDGIWYHIATIEDDTIRVYWYLPEDDEKQLYWEGTFVPPTSAEEPYSWESRNDYTEEMLADQYEYNRTSREPTKTFTYKNGTLSYYVTNGNLRMTFGLQKKK